MPRAEILMNFNMQVVNGAEPDESDGQVGMVDNWTLVFTERSTGDQIRITFRRDARDELVRQLTGGIVLAGGDLPKV